MEVTETTTINIEQLRAKVEAQPYWYHKIALPGGIVTKGWAPLNAARYSIPEDLTGKRVLDIGAWDGYWTWEALKRGAKEVVAIDDFSDTCGQPITRDGKWVTFDICREAFGFTDPIGGCQENEEGNGIAPVILGWRNAKGQIVSRLETSVYDLHPMSQHFDIVFFFGTLYHCRHPLLAFEKIASVCDGSLYVETACLDDYSPYRGGVGHGYCQNDVVMEFYPGTQYGNNPGNWWVPTLQCAGAMMASVGFKNVEAWPLTDRPGHIGECRGFLSGTNNPAKEPALHPPDVDAQVRTHDIRVSAVMSVPRLGFHDNMTCAFEALSPLHIPMCKVQGAYWAQCLERGLLRVIDEGADIVLTIDYDTVFTRADVEALLRLMIEHPEAAALVSVQAKRGEWSALLTIKGRSGQPLPEVPLTEFGKELSPIATGHFGLTALRVKDLLEVPHPWFHGQPNSDGYWGDGRIDADIWFWKQLERAGKRVYSANRVVVGHLELMAAWPTQAGTVVLQSPTDYHKAGKPADCWK